MICTFYSYKGGVGRSMALANVADLFARRGLKVLIVDFDLEAPGLEQFFLTNTAGIRREFGLIDLLRNCKGSMSVAGTDPLFKELRKFICPIYDNLPGGGCLHIMGAGQRQKPEQLARYAVNVRTFDWQDFYYNWEGELFFEWFRRSLIPDLFDVVLIDSRTGVTEMGGVCGYQLADLLLMLCGANQQNIEGTANMVRDFRSPNVEHLRQGRALDILIVPARVEQRSDVLLKDFYGRLDSAFSKLVPDQLKHAGLSFRDLTIPYEPDYAFEERVPSDPSRVPGRKRIGVAFQGLASAIALLAEPGSRLASIRLEPEHGRDQSLEADELEVLGLKSEQPAQPRFDVTKRFAEYDALVDYDDSDRDAAGVIIQHLEERGLRIFANQERVAVGSEWDAMIEEALFHSRAIVYCVGTRGLSQQRLSVLEKALTLHRGAALAVFPVVLPGADFEAARGTPLEKLAWLDFRSGPTSPNLDSIDRVLSSRREERAQLLEKESRAPYVGFNPFDEEYADLFFGRQSVIEKLLLRLKEEHFVALTGSSGSGKTSVVRAGLIPTLRREKVLGETVVAMVRPSAHPLSNLAIAVQIHLPELALAEVQNLLGDSRDGLKVLVDKIVSSAPESNDRRSVLIFVDQIEEIFTLVQSREEASQFVTQIARLTAACGDQVFVMLAIRADFFPSLLELRELAELVEGHLFMLPPMYQEQLREAIEKPAATVGVAFEPGLVDRILEDAKAETGFLPLLQHILLLLWEQRRGGWLTNRAYDDLGGLRGVLSTSAEQTIKTFTHDELEVCRGIFTRLVKLAGPLEEVQDSRRNVRLSELRSASTDYVLFDRVLGKLVDGRLLGVSFERGEEPIVHIAHEALIGGWVRMRVWLNEDREFLLWRERLGALLREWELTNKSEEVLPRGPLLVEAQKWFDHRNQDLSDQEREFISVSWEQRERLAREERERQEHELEDAQRLAWAEAARAEEAEKRRKEQVEAAQKLAEEQKRLAAAETARAEEAEKREQEEKASSLLRERLAREEKERQEREIESARKLAEEQKQRAELSEHREKEQKEAARKLRRRAIVTAGAAGVALIFLVVSVFLWRKSESASAKAEEQAKEANMQRIAAESARVAALEQEKIATALRLAYASSELLGKDIQTSLLLAVEAVKVAEAAKRRVAAAEQSLVDALGSDASRLFAQGESKIDSVAFSLDGHWLVTGSSDGMVRLWDLTAKDPTAIPVVLRGHEDAVTTVAISSDNRWLVTASFDKTVRLWDLSAKDPEANPVVLRGHEGAVITVAISPDSRWLMTGSEDGTARVWDLAAKDPAANPVVLRGHERGVTTVAISPNASWLVTGSEDGTARLWDLTARDPAANPVVLRGGEGAVTTVAISPDNRWLMTGSEDGTARVWDLTARDTAAKPVILRGHTGPVTAVAISPDARWLVTGSLDKTARLWDLVAVDPATSSIVLRGQAGGVTAIAISSDASWLATGSEDHTTRLWDLTAKDPTISAIVLRSQQGAITSVAISTDNRWLVTVSSDGTARLWTLRVSELIELARSKVNRNLTTNEWRLYFPGQEYRKTFSDLPGPD